MRQKTLIKFQKEPSVKYDLEIIKESEDLSPKFRTETEGIEVEESKIFDGDISSIHGEETNNSGFVKGGGIKNGNQRLRESGFKEKISNGNNEEDYEKLKVFYTNSSNFSEEFQF